MPLDPAFLTAAYAAMLLAYSDAAEEQVALGVLLGEAAAEAALGYIAKDPTREAQAVVHAFEYDRLKTVASGQETRVRDIIEEAQRQGKGTRLLARDLRSALPGADDARLRMIARTETNRAGNIGQFNAWIRSGLVESKQFSATMDDATRPGHAAAHLEIVPLHAEFTRGDAMGHVSPPLAPNCRCSMAPITTGNPSGRTDPGPPEGLDFTAASEGIPGLLAAESMHEDALLGVVERYVNTLIQELGEPIKGPTLNI